MKSLNGITFRIQINATYFLHITCTITLSYSCISLHFQNQSNFHDNTSFPSLLLRLLLTSSYTSLASNAASGLCFTRASALEKLNKRKVSLFLLNHTHTLTDKV